MFLCFHGIVSFFLTRSSSSVGCRAPLHYLGEGEGWKSHFWHNVRIQLLWGDSAEPAPFPAQRAWWDDTRPQSISHCRYLTLDLSPISTKRLLSFPGTNHIRTKMCKTAAVFLTLTATSLFTVVEHPTSSAFSRWSLRGMQMTRSRHCFR